MATLLISLMISAIAALLLALGVVPESMILNCESALVSLASKRFLLSILIPALSLILNITIAIRNGIPQPRVQDEFSYLLACDTFSQGRLANPTPRFWEHFETPHELMRPSYMSKYPPGQGLVLALGFLLSGMPIVGVWLATAAACGIIYWMLLGFLPSSWSLAGGVVAVLHPELLHWSQMYWGGCIAVAGGALLLGSWSRLIHRSGVISSLLFGLGLVILANSRPYEGLLVALPLTVHLVWNKKYRLNASCGLIVILIPASIWMGYYNFRITGHLLRMPFFEYSNQYDVYPKFWFLPKRTAPVFLNNSMQLIHTMYERGDYDQLRNLSSFIKVSTLRLWMLITAISCPFVLSIPLLFGVRQLGLAVMTVGIFVFGIWAENFFLPHYAAPIIPFFILMSVMGCSRLRQAGRIGRITSRSLAIGFVLSSLIGASASVDLASIREGQRELISHTAELQTGKHLIFVGYTSDHLMHDEWVYNAADLEHSRVIWAREMGSTADAPMVRYFKDRQLWNLTVGKDSLQLTRYSEVR